MDGCYILHCGATPLLYERVTHSDTRIYTSYLPNPVLIARHHSVTSGSPTTHVCITSGDCPRGSNIQPSAAFTTRPGDAVSCVSNCVCFVIYTHCLTDFHTLRQCICLIVTIDSLYAKQILSLFKINKHTWAISN